MIRHALAAVAVALPAVAAAQASVTLADATGRGETVTVRGTTDQPLAHIKIQGDRVKLRDAGGVERWRVKRKDYGAEIENGAGERLYRSGSAARRSGSSRTPPRRRAASPCGERRPARDPTRPHRGRGRGGEPVARAERRDLRREVAVVLEDLVSGKPVLAPPLLVDRHNDRRSRAPPARRAHAVRSVERFTSAMKPFRLPRWVRCTSAA